MAVIIIQLQYWQRDCLFNNLCRLATKDTPKLYCICPLWWEITRRRQRASKVEIVSMSWRLHAKIIKWWFSARLQYLQCVSKGDTVALHWAIKIPRHSPSWIFWHKLPQAMLCFAIPAARYHKIRDLSSQSPSPNRWWRHQMEAFSALLALCAGNSQVTGNKGQGCGALMFSLIPAWTNRWINNRYTGDLRRHRAHYDVTVMRSLLFTQVFTSYSAMLLLNHTHRYYFIELFSLAALSR